MKDQAEKLGEEGQLGEAAEFMTEIEKLGKQKAELEAALDQTSVKQDRNMQVCQVCGALQQAGDADKRLTMHLEGKLHTGYAKIRKKLNDLKAKRASDSKNGRLRSRSRSPRRRERRDFDDTEPQEKFVLFSSKKFGSGKNVPKGDFSSFKFANLAMEQNQGYSGAFVAMDNTSLGKEWKYYKRELD